LCHVSNTSFAVFEDERRFAKQKTAEPEDFAVLTSNKILQQLQGHYGMMVFKKATPTRGLRKESAVAETTALS